MDAKELRQFNVDELKSRVRTWQEELFRSKFRAQSSEAKDTSIFRKLRRDIARGKTILAQKISAGETGGGAGALPTAQAAETSAQEVRKTASEAPKDKPAKKATSKKTTTAKKSKAKE